MAAVTSAVDTVRLNVGAGDYHLPRAQGWVNIDQMEPADLILTVPPLPYRNGTVAEVYAGHFLEHLERTDAADFLDECWRVLEPGGKLAILVPDTREVMRRYVLGEPAPVEWPAGHHRDLRDLDEACEMIIFSTAQPSHHRWAYDTFTLNRALAAAGFTDITEFDRFRDPRIGVGAWYQVGLEAWKA